MNIYRYQFIATCPADGEVIVYQLEIRSLKMIMVEHIKTATALIKSGFHEHIADQLSEQFGGYQTIIAVHQGVGLETVRLAE